MAAALRRAGARLASAPRPRGWRSRANELAVERRALDRAQPGRPAGRVARTGRPALRSSDAGDLATRLGDDRAAPRSRRRGDVAEIDRRRRIAGARSSRSTPLAAAAAALGVLGPQATLDRGYAIVRGAPTGRIVRGPSDTPARTGLRIRVAEGSIAATVDDPADGVGDAADRATSCSRSSWSSSRPSGSAWYAPRARASTA